MIRKKTKRKRTLSVYDICRYDLFPYMTVLPGKLKENGILDVNSCRFRPLSTLPKRMGRDLQLAISDLNRVERKFRIKLKHILEEFGNGQVYGRLGL